MPPLLRGRRTKRPNSSDAAARHVRESKRASLGPVVAEPKPKGVAVCTVIVSKAIEKVRRRR